MEKIAASNSMGRPAYNHDIRQTFTNNITRELSRDNVVLVDELKGRSVDEYLDELLQPAVDEYNARQKRKDRKIPDRYTDWHKMDKRKGDLVYELVMQYGDRDTIGRAYYQAEDPESKRAMREEIERVYRKWLKDWQEQHPGMKVLWCTIHFDEENGTPHMHMAVSPIARDFQRGPSMQVSMQKCLENDGFPRGGNFKEGFQLTRAFEKFREIQERDLIELGYEIKEPTRGVHQEPELFRQVEAAKDELAATKEDLAQALGALEALQAQTAAERARSRKATEKAAQAEQMLDKVKDIAVEYVQQAQEAQETAQTATEQAEIAKKELEAAQGLVAAHEDRAAELAEQHSQQQAQIAQGQRDLHELSKGIEAKQQHGRELDRKLVVKQTELNNIINGLSVITDKLDDAKKSPAKGPEILERIEKDRWGRKLERPKAMVYEDELQAIKQQAQITPRMEWLQDAVKAVIRELKKLFKVDDLISPWQERAEKAEREARAQQIERDKSDRELRKMRWFIRDRGLEAEYDRTMEQEIHHVHHMRR